MKKYSSVYAFNVLDELVEGADIKMLDREKCLVYDAAEMKAGELSRAIKSTEKSRFEFWKVEESESSNEQ